MTVRRCTGCHRYISGAPTPDLEHNGKYGSDCQAEHHPDPCDYIHREHGACTHYGKTPSPVPALDLNNGTQSKLTAVPQFVQQPPISLASAGEEVKQAMVSDSRQLMTDFHGVDTMIRLFPSNLMSVDILSSYEQKLKDIEDKFLEFSRKVVMFAMDHSSEQAVPKAGDGSSMDSGYWQAKEQELGQRLTAHQAEIRKCANDLKSRRIMSEFERRDIEIRERELKLKEEQVDLLRKSQSKLERTERTKANALAQSKYEEILHVSSEIEEFIDKVTDWSKATRSEVMTAMKSLEKWSIKFDDLNRAHREFILATSDYMLPSESQSVEEVMPEITKKYKDVVAAIQHEDKIRELYSLAGSNKEQVKLPKFAGAAGEDFATFKSKLLLAFEKNMTPAADKVEGLRSCLSGAALALVPEKTNDFAKALDVLKEAFGNPERVMAVRLNDVKKLGKCPPEVLNGKRNFQAIVSFCLKVEVLLQDLLDLAQQEGCEELNYDVYGSAFRTNIQRLFSMREEKKMRFLQKRGRAGLEEHLDYIKEIRGKAQAMVDTASDPRDKPSRRDDEHVERDSKKGSGHSIFKQPRRVSDCRICMALETVGSTELFENHISEGVTGCPKFQAMSAEERRNICMKAKMCMKCCDHKVTFNIQHRRECKVTKKNKIYATCSKHPDCTMHSWLCGYHQDDNKSKIDEFTNKFKIKPPVNTNTAAVPTKPVVDTAKVLKNMKRNLKKRGADLIPIPEGDSMFILAPLKGITEPVLGFFDSGCSDAVARHGVPGKQLAGICVNEGPISCFGVGATEITAKQEWIVKLKRKDGNYQLVQTLTMDTVCAPMPVVNTERAVAELKESDQDSTALQNCCVPPQVGGNVDIILGIRYNNVAPKAIHNLETGLTIYSINLETHDPSYNAAIGGPHSSFSAILNYNGGLTKVTQSLQTLYLTLDNFKKYGPPSIPVFPTSKKDQEARLYFFREEFDICGQVDVLDDVDLYEYDEIVTGCSPSSAPATVGSPSLVSVADYSPSSAPATVGSPSLVPATDRSHSCCNNFAEEDSKLRDMKHWYKQIEGGTSVEYRCPACRECSKCKNSDATERISLREEVEQKAVEDSIHFDRKNKKVMVELPKRGEEEFFLTSNRDVAKKFYQKIAEKVSKNEETKAEVNAAFQKLFKNGHAIYLADVEKERLDKFITKSVQHYIPWSLVWKADSITTPCRPVFDASKNTRKRPDGLGGGRSLNDLLCKGRVDTLNLLKMVIRFVIGTFGITGDLQQFYCCCKLVDKELNLTRFLYNPTMDPRVEPVECLIQALIYGLKSASAQTESMKKKLAGEIRPVYPDLALLLDESTYVDDMGESKDSEEAINSLADDADKVLGELSVTVKAWSKTGVKPSTTVSDDGVSVLVAGMQWFPEMDSISIRVPPLHFGKRRRGKLDKNTEFFHTVGDSKDIDRLEKFCPVLTRRICASKAASIFDLMGLLAPVLAGVKLLMSETVKATDDWDEEIPENLRSKWLIAFLRIESLRNIQFHRPVMPSNAVNTNLRLIGLSDAAKPIIMVGIWGGFELPDGSFSCRLIIGRSILSSDTTIPKLELDGACSVANLGWMVKTALKGWDVSYVQAADSTIALSWITSEQLRLSEFHRNRVVQIRRAVEIGNIYHVRTDLNVSDCGTRPDKVRVEDVMAGSRWHNGDQWMTWPVEKAVNEGCIIPAIELRVSDAERNDFKEGIIFEKVPELLTRGHVLNKERISKIQDRAKVSEYVVLPTKYGFSKSFRITALVIKFVVKCRKGKPFMGPKLSLPLGRIPPFNFHDSLHKCGPVLLSDDGKDVDPKFRLSSRAKAKLKNMLDTEMMVEEEYCSKLAMTYIFRTATEELKKFVKAESLEKMALEDGGILYSKSRLLEEMEFKVVSEMDTIKLDSLGINTRTPIVDRYSPLAYAIAQHIHYEVSGHSGLETCNRLSMERVFILQGVSLYREISDECMKCKIKRRKFLRMSMGPIGEHNLTVAPPFYACQADLYGPVSVYAPGAQKDLRGRPPAACKVWSLVFACPVTRLINCQVVEKSDHSGIVDGLTRLAAEVGFPKYLMVDQDGSIMKALKEVTVNMRDLQHRLFTEHGVMFTTCPVGGHNMHGHIERVIRSVQELLDEGNVKKKRLHATGYQTLLKLVENLYNSLPIGYSFDKSLSNTPLLRIITPNFFKMGRSNARTLEGPVHVPNGSEMVKKVSETYQGLFKLWADVYVPKLIFAPKWYKDDQNLKEGDMVYMKKSPDNKLDSAWVVGIVEQVIPSRDGKVRRVIVKYSNVSGSPDYDATPQLTDRAVRQLVKIFDIEEYVLQEDLAELMRRLNSADEGNNDSTVSQEGHYTVKNDDSTGPLEVRRTVKNKPMYYQTLVDKCSDTQTPLNNSISEELANSFTLADSQVMFSKHVQASNLSDFEGLMQLLSCTDMNLE